MIVDSALFHLLHADPVMQAMFEASRQATAGLQAELLDAVLTDDHRVVRDLLEEEDHSHLLPDDFFLNIAILLIAKGSPPLLKVFQTHGYDASCAPFSSNQLDRIKLGELALLLCPVDRQRELVENGFMNPATWASKGMGHSNPEIFDLWQGYYLADEADQRARLESRVSNAGGSRPAPEADEEIFRWLPPSKTRRIRPIESTSQCAEIARRLDKQLSAFFDLHYPAATENERWDLILARPFQVAGSIHQAVVVDRYATLLGYQLARTPAATRSLPLPDLRRGDSARWASALLKSGFQLSDFTSDLPSHLLRVACDMELADRRVPESVSYLWSAVRQRMAQEMPERLAALPPEIASPYASLSLSFTAGEHPSAAARLAFIDLVALSAQTTPAPTPPAALRGPRL